MYPVLEILRNTDQQWLIDTLYAFISGVVDRFQILKPAWGQQPDLAANEAQLLRKIQLLCLMEVKALGNPRQQCWGSASELASPVRLPASQGPTLTCFLPFASAH